MKEQAKRYRFVGTGYRSKRLIVGEIYSEDYTYKFDNRTFTVRQVAQWHPQDWQLVTDEPEPFTPTHEVNNGQLRNEPVKVIHAKSDGFCKVEDREGISHFFHIDDLTPLDIEQQTTLTAQQYESLISTMYKMFGVKSPNQIVKTWANQNNVKILEQ